MVDDPVVTQAARVADGEEASSFKQEEYTLD